MTEWLGIDLSERYSAAVLIAATGEPMLWWTGDFGTRNVHHSVLIGNMLSWMDEILDFLHPVGRADPDSISYRFVLEDTPSRVLNPKPAMRLSGALLGHLLMKDWWNGALNAQPLLVSPGVWQKELGFKPDPKLGRKTSAQRKVFSKAYAAERGFVPEGTAKEREDLCDAFCIAEYGRRASDPVTE